MKTEKNWIRSAETCTQHESIKQKCFWKPVYLWRWGNITSNVLWVFNPRCLSGLQPMWTAAYYKQHKVLFPTQMNVNEWLKNVGYSGIFKETTTTTLGVYFEKIASYFGVLCSDGKFTTWNLLMSLQCHTLYSSVGGKILYFLKKSPQHQTPVHKPAQLLLRLK